VVKLKKFTQIDYNYWSNFITWKYFWSYLFLSLSFFSYIVM